MSTAASNGTNKLNQRIYGLLSPIVEAEGYELISAELVSDRGRAVLRAYIDTVPPSDERRGVSIDDCTHISRLLGDVLDIEDIIKGEYHLEVSSPGIFRPLTKPEHFVRAEGQRVRVKTFAKLDGRKVFVGQLKQYAEDRLLIDVDGSIFEVPTAEIAKANLEPLLNGM